MDDAFVKKKLPYNLDAELSVIGSMFMNRDVIADVVDLIDKEDFYNSQNAILFENIVDLYKAGMAVDLVTLTNRLKEKNLPEELASLEFVSNMVAGVPTSVNAVHYARIVADKAVLRRTIKMCESLEKDCYLDTDDVDALLERAESGIFNIVQQRNASNNFTSITDITLSVIKQIQKASKQHSRVTGLPTGFVDLDNMLTGLHGSELVLVAARPAMGKTAFVLNIAHNVAVRQNKSVAIFSLEMSKEQLVTRMVAIDSMVDSQRIQTGQLDDDDWTKLRYSMEGLAKSKLYIDDNSAITMADLRSKCRKLAHQTGLDLIIIDYLQLMSPKGKVESRQQFISEMSRSLKVLARELDVPVIALSQLNRSVDGRPDHHPVLADLRESGAIEQDADVVMFIYRDEYYKKDESEKKGLAEITIAKQRKGATGSVDLMWMQQYTKFANYNKKGDDIR